MRLIPIFILLLAMPVLAATVWKWRDADGVMHYSDQPAPGAEQMTVEDSSTFSSPHTTGRTSSHSEPAPTATAPAYSNVEIWKPGPDAAIANTAGQVGVAVRVEPRLQPGHRLALYLDGHLVPAFPEQGMEYELSNVERGDHGLQLVVIDSRGTQVKSSAAVTFHVIQPSVLNKLAH